MPRRTAVQTPDEITPEEEPEQEQEQEQEQEERKEEEETEGSAAPAPAEVKANPALAPVPLDMLGDAEDVPEEQWEETALKAPDERDEAQLRVDADVKAAYDAWMKAGKPAVSKSPRKRRAVAPQHGPAVRHMLGKAGRLHGVKVVISPVAHDKDGREIIVFSARDKEVKARKANEEIQAVRAWAKAHDAALPEGDPARFDLADRGRIPEEVQGAYDAVKAFEAAEAADAHRAGNEEAGILLPEDAGELVSG
jgi:hypothetical protein